MTALQSTPEPGAGQPPDDFSIILGGPLYQLLRRAHVTDSALHLVRRRVLVISLFAWLPLLLLSLVHGDAFRGVAVPFIGDLQVHIRFLVALPLLVFAELVVHERLRPVAQEFVTRDLLADDSGTRFAGILDGAMRMRNSVIAEVLMIVTVYAVGVPVLWRQASVLTVPTWYASAADTGAALSLAGVWYAYVSVPIFQFLLLRWYYRMVIWMVFLWRLSRLRLNLSAMHADRMGGLGFLAITAHAFVPLAMAHGALLAGTIANRIFYTGAQLVDARFEIAAVLGVLFLLVFGPLVVFAPPLMAAKRAAARMYGRLGQRYVRDFEATWLPGGVPAPTSPLGTADIQSLADLGTSFENMRAMRAVPITRDTVLLLAGATLLPVAPLMLTVIPAEEIAKHLLKLVL